MAAQFKTDTIVVNTEVSKTWENQRRILTESAIGSSRKTSILKISVMKN